MNEKIDHLISQIRLSKESEENLQRFIDLLNNCLQKKFGDYNPTLMTLGSFANGLGTFDSDLDIFVKFDQLFSVILDYNTALLSLEAIEQILSYELNEKKFSSTIVKSRRCPIIKLNFRLYFHRFRNEISNDEFRKELEFNKCDISVKSIYGVLNSKFLNFLSKYEERFYKMALILKFWAKEAELIDRYALSTYAFTMLIIYFLQAQQPQILPSVELLQNMAKRKKNFKPLKVHKWNFEFCDDINQIGRSCNRSSVQELLVQFFK